MSQKLASHQIPTGPVVGLLLSGSIMVKGREATRTDTTPIFLTCVLPFWHLRPGLERGKWWAGQFLLR